MTRRSRLSFAAALAASLGAACTVERTDGDRPATQGGAAPSATAPSATAPSAPVAAPAAPGPATPAAPAADSLVDPSQVPPEQRPRADMRLEVDLNARRVTVYRGQAQAATYPVAVGSPEWPTQPGEWAVSQVVWNPEWVPPDESWAEQRERKAPGAPDNPLGRAQLVYDPPRTVHGTNEPNSIGRAVSHGSIRMRNADITALARDVMAAAGVAKDSAWYRQVEQNRSEKQVVDLPRVVPIRVF